MYGKLLRTATFDICCAPTDFTDHMILCNVNRFVFVIVL